MVVTPSKNKYKTRSPRSDACYVRVASVLLAL